MKEIETKEIEVYKSQVSELEKQAIKLPITSPEENAIVIEFKAKLNKLGKEIKAEKEKATKPINEALRKVREWWSPIEKRVEAWETEMGNALLAYKRKVEEEARKKEAQLAARVEKGTMKLETAERKIEEIPQIQKTTHTEAGQVQFRKVPMMRIIDENLIPDKYWVVDLVALRKDVVNEGIIVPGAEKYYEERV